MSKPQNKQQAAALRTIAIKMGLAPNDEEIPSLYKSGNGDCWWLSVDGNPEDRVRDERGRLPSISVPFGPSLACGFSPDGFVIIPSMGGLSSADVGRRRLRAAMDSHFGEVDDAGISRQLNPLPSATEDEWDRALAALISHFRIEP